MSLESANFEDDIDADELRMIFENDNLDSPWEKDQIHKDNERIMAMIISKMKLGCAYLDVEENLIYIMEEMEETKDYQMTNICLEQIKPDLILLSVRNDPLWIDMIKEFPCSVEFLTSSSFSIETAKMKMFNCANYDRVKIEGNSKSFCCAGSLLKKRKNSLVNSNDAIEIQWITVKGFMHLDENVLRCLQIISHERHPNMHSSIIKSNLSLYGIMDKPKSTFGKKLFDMNFKRPLCDISLINQRLDLVEYFVETEERGLNLCKSIKESLGGLGNIKTILKNISSSNNYRDFHQILKFLLAAEETRLSFPFDALEKRKNDNQMSSASSSPLPPLLKRVMNLNSELLISLKNVISHCIDFEESKLRDRITIRPFVNECLDELRRSYNDLPDYLSKIVNEIAKEITNSTFINSLNVVYFPQLGYLIAIPLEDMSVAPLISNETNFVIQFTTERIAYFKNDRMKELDGELGDIHGEMMDLEIEIIENLRKSLIEYQKELFDVIEIMAQLDFIVALAAFANKFQLKRPVINKGKSFKIRQSRHLLLDIASQGQVVSNDCNLDSNQAIILTGANGSGKSIFLKQIGQLVFLAHLGSFVPALEAEIGLVDRMFCRMKMTETISCDHSAFQSECLQIKSMLNAMTFRSFLMIDEFGKGTLVQDGISLFAGLIKYIMTERDKEQGKDKGKSNDTNDNQFPSCPRMMAITHFHEIFTIFDNVDYIKWNCTLVNIEHQEEEDNGGNSRQIIKFQYKIIDGKATTSFARHCASRAGIASSIISRAEQLERLYSSMIPSQDIRYANINPELEKANQLLTRQLLQDQLEY